MLGIKTTERLFTEGGPKHWDSDRPDELRRGVA
jgi:hypothetical protein